MQDLNELGRSTFAPCLFYLDDDVIHKFVIWCLVITDFDNQVSKQTRPQKSYYEELLQVRLEHKKPLVFKMYLEECLTRFILFCQLSDVVQLKSSEQNGGGGLVLRARGCGEGIMTSNRWAKYSVWTFGFTRNCDRPAFECGIYMI